MPIPRVNPTTPMNDGSAYHDELHNEKSDRIEEVSVNVKSYGAVGNGSTDDSTAIQNAIDALPATGGHVFFPHGTYRVVTALNLRDLHSVKLTGQGGLSAGAYTSAVIQLESNAFIDCRGSTGMVIEDLYLWQVNAAYTGVVLDLSYNGAGDAALNQVVRCNVIGGANAKSCIQLNNTIISSIRDCNISGANTGIRVDNTYYANAIKVDGCQFVSNVLAHIYADGGLAGWEIASCTFEGLSGGDAGMLLQSSTGNTEAIDIHNNWAGDVSVGDRPQIEIRGGGWSITGNFIANHTSGCKVIEFIDDGVKGVSIQGNQLYGGAISIDFGTTIQHRAIVIQGNRFQNETLPIGGTIPEHAIVDLGRREQAHDNGPTLGGRSISPSDETIAALIAVGWVPSMLPGLLAEFDATKMVGDGDATNDGDPVAQWTDQSGNGYHAVQATAGYKPLYKTAIQNGLPVVRFDGADDWLLTSSITHSDPAVTIFGVLIPRDLFVADDAILHAYDTANYFWQWKWGTSIRTGGYKTNYDQCEIQLVTAGYGIGDAMVITHVQDFSQPAGYESWSWVDGQDLSVRSTDYDNSGNMQNGRMAIGTNTGTYAQVDIGQLLMFDRRLNDFERKLVETYLKTIWGTN